MSHPTAPRSFAALLLMALSFNTAFGQVDIHVSSLGVDTGAGTPNDPLKTIQGARNLIRQLRTNKKLDNQSVTVLLHPGRYEQTTTIEFTAEDSGSPEHPIVYRSVDGKVIITGGTELSGWQKVTRPDLLERLPVQSHDHVMCVDIGALGIQPGNIHARRLHHEMHPTALELHASGERLQNARWPNTGWATANAHSPSGEQPLANAWLLDRAIDIGDIKNAWAHGFWKYDWQDAFVPIQIDPSTKVAKFAPSANSTDNTIRNGARYRLSNMLCELDMPGEWYLDEPTKTLIYWPRESVTDVPVTASTLDTVLSIYDTENLVFQGIRFESARSMVVEIVGGRDVQLRDCQIAHAGNVGVHVFHGSNHRLSECDIHCTGSSAVRIEGGDRTTLTPAEHCIEKCHVHQFCLDYLAGRPAVAIYGVGNVVHGNHIHEGPDSAICLFGNEHLVEHNHISHVCRESDDSAAIHLSHDPTYRGNIIRKNHIHDLGGFSKTGVFGIYLDDFASGTTVSENVLSNTVRGIVVGGGRDNVIEKNNIQGALASIQIDARGTTWAQSQIKDKQSRIQSLCKSTLNQNPVYAEKYPELVTFLADQPWLPKGNVIRSNVYDSPIGIDLQGVAPQYVVIESNTRSKVSNVASKD